MIGQYYTPVDKSATNSPRSIIRPEIGLFTKTTFPKKNILIKCNRERLCLACTQALTAHNAFRLKCQQVQSYISPLLAHQSAVPPTCEIPLRAASKALIGVQRLRPDFDASRFFKILHSPAQAVIIPIFVNFGTSPHYLGLQQSLCKKVHHRRS